MRGSRIREELNARASGLVWASRFCTDSSLAIAIIRRLGFPSILTAARGWEILIARGWRWHVTCRASLVVDGHLPGWSLWRRPRRHQW